MPLCVICNQPLSTDADRTRLAHVECEESELAELAAGDRHAESVYDELAAGGPYEATTDEF